jgi:2-amino-4-hydroxy-6-hydroxymethyldihydropteridine diphosphokinase
MTRAVLALGGNLADARAALAAAVAALEGDPRVRVRAVSGLWRTAPVGGPDQPDYLNAVVLVDAAINPEELLAVAQELEQAAGRRREVRWGPRTLDVDVIDVAGVRSDDPELTLPHPRAHERAFVLAPWLEVDPAGRIEVDGRAVPIADLLAALGDQPVTPIARGEWWR